MTALPYAWLVGWFRFLVMACAVMALCGGAHAQTTQPFRPTLFACGSADRYWIASLESYREGTKVHFKTLVRGQTLPGGIWEDLGVVYGHTVGMTEVQDELAVLLDDGSWKRVGAAGLSTGPAIPGSGPVLAWGSAGSVLYTIRAVEGGKDAVTTRPVDTTQPVRSTIAPSSAPTTMRAMTPATRTVAATGPASQPTTRPLTLALLRFDNGQWVGVADLPAGAALGSLTLWGVGKQPVLAALEESGAIRTWILVNSRWEDWGEIRAGARPGMVGGFAMGNTAGLWTIDQDGGLKLFMRREGEEWAAAKAFVLPKSLPEGSQRTLAAAGEEIRLILLKDGKMWEQRYDAAGAMRGGLTELSAPQIYKENPMVRVFQLVVLLAMVIVMVVTFYKRRGAGGRRRRSREDSVALRRLTGNNGCMSVLGGTSMLREFLEFMAQKARAFSLPDHSSLGIDLRHELDSFVGLGLAAYEELGELTREATEGKAAQQQTQPIIDGVREAHAKYLEACQPVLRMVDVAAQAGIRPKRLEQFLETVGEANLIANRYERVIKAEREAEGGRTRGAEEIRDELRRRIHLNGDRVFRFSQDEKRIIVLDIAGMPVE